jgi:DNA modification methylase
MKDVIFQGNVIKCLKKLPNNIVHCVVTSPPYYALRDYGVPGQIGLEETPEAYIAKMVEVFRAVRRVLRKDGTLWLNLGDSYATGTSADRRDGKRGIGDATQAAQDAVSRNGNPFGLAAKNLVGIPWRVAFALQADGWYLRSDIIWAKPNPMPESVTDRPTKAHEYLFLLSKSARYFYDAEAIREDAKVISGQNFRARARTAAGALGGENQHHMESRAYTEVKGANRRTVWTIATEPYPEAHFATFPRKLVQPCILAGCPEHACPKCGAPWVKEVEKSGGTTCKSWHDHSDDLGRGQQKNENGMDTYRVEVTGEHPTCACGLPPIGGTVLDPFIGSGTTGLVAKALFRFYIGIELKPQYITLARKRVSLTQIEKCRKDFAKIRARR